MIIPYGYYGEKIKILQDIQKAIENELYKINLYPSPTKQVLKEARYNSVKPENIIPTNGSDEALEFIAKVFISENDEVIMPLPSYPCFESVSQMMGAKITTISLEENFT